MTDKELVEFLKKAENRSLSIYSTLLVYDNYKAGDFLNHAANTARAIATILLNK